MGEHPVITVVLLLILLTGGCTIGISIGILSSHPKLMPY
jgi:hypothetical protein